MNNIDFVPKLISHQDGVLNIKYLDGETLFDLLLKNKPFNYKKVVEQIALIDRFLFQNKINVLGLHLKDFMIVNDKLMLYDFEYTFLNSRFKNILFDQCLIYTKKKA